MRLQTHLSNTIDSVESVKLQYDKQIKEILSAPQILARILKYVVEEFKELTFDEIIACINTKSIEIGTTPVNPGLTSAGKIESTQTENSILNEGYITFDIRFMAVSQEQQIKLIINIESQRSLKNYELGYHLENRIIYYLSRLISSQKEVEFFHDDYDNIRKVYSIFICMDAGKEDDSISKIFLDSETVYGKTYGFSNLDKMCGVVVHIRTGKKIKESQNKLIAMLEDLFEKEDNHEKKFKLESKYGLKMTTEFNRRVIAMSYISDFIYEEGIEKGIEEKQVSVIERMLKRNLPLEDIADISDCPMETVLQIQEKLLQSSKCV